MLCITIFKGEAASHTKRISELIASIKIKNTLQKLIIIPYWAGGRALFKSHKTSVA
jgi:hypothetical protein